MPENCPLPNHRPRPGLLTGLAALMAACTSAGAGGLGEDWFLYDRLTMSGQELGADFGSAVAMSGEWAVVGARRDDNGPQNVGRLEFWQRSPGQGTWIRRDIEYPPGATADDLLGEFVDIDGDFAVATAGGLDWLGDPLVGAAIVYRRRGSTWNLDGQLLDPDGVGAFMSYADDVAISGNTMAVSYASAAAGGVQRGKVDLFVRGPTTWGQLQTIAGTIDGLRLPSDLDLEGDTLVIGVDRANGFVRRQGVIPCGIVGDTGDRSLVQPGRPRRRARPPGHGNGAVGGQRLGKARAEIARAAGDQNPAVSHAGWPRNRESSG